MESENKPEETSPRKDDSVTPPDCNDACTAADDPFEVNTVSGNKSGEDRILIIPLDVLAKGTPPPTTGDPSPGRNHVTATVVSGDGGKDRVNLLEAMEKSTPPPSTGDSSRGRNSIN